MDFITNYQNIKLITICILGFATYFVGWKNKKKQKRTITTKLFSDKNFSQYQGDQKGDIQKFFQQQNKTLFLQIQSLLKNTKEQNIKSICNNLPVSQKQCPINNSIISTQITRPLQQGEVVAKYRQNLFKMDIEFEQPRKLRTNQEILCQDKIKKVNKTKLIKKVQKMKFRRQKRARKIYQRVKRQMDKEKAQEEQKKTKQQSEGKGKKILWKQTQVYFI